MGAYGDYVLVFAVAAVVTFLGCFPARRVARRLGVLAEPGESHVHAKATPTIGGSAMLIAFAAAMLVSSRLPGLHSIFAGSSEPLGVLAAGAVIWAVGLLDDVREISAPAKVAGQVIAAMVLVFLGVTMYYFKIPFVGGIISLSSSWLPLITAIWVVGMANAVNLIDGLDGLAAGIVAIASAALCIYSLHLVVLGYLPPGTDELGPLVAAITCGVCVGFLPHNFHPARAFMGDSGSMLLGLMMAAATMVIGGRTGSLAGDKDVSGLTFFRFAPLFIPFFILGVPILDTTFAIVRRTVRRTGVAERDLGHLHHRLIRLGHGHRRSVLILWAWTAALSAFVLYPTFEHRANAWVLPGAVFLCVALYTVFQPGRRARSVAPQVLAAAEDAGIKGAGAELGSALPGSPSAVAGAHSVVRASRPSAPRPAAAAPPLATMSERASSERSGASAVPVVMSGAAGIAVAGSSELASPRSRRRHARRRVLRLTWRRDRIGDAETGLPG